MLSELFRQQLKAAKAPLWTKEEMKELEDKIIELAEEVWDEDEENQDELMEVVQNDLARALRFLLKASKLFDQTIEELYHAPMELMNIKVELEMESLNRQIESFLDEFHLDGLEEEKE
jgi:alcohol dehydrogenase YqhD (iron-dependent ADH family)